MQDGLTISKLAELAQVNVETIRYYQRRGLLEEPRKPPGGYRRYPAEMAKRVYFIKRAQTLGFTLEEVAELMGLDAATACGETQELAVQKLELIERKLADLTAMRTALTHLVHACDERRYGEPCPIIRSLGED
ncbi:Hg(II)-responsive transcriptional regulator [Edaphobacter bradus]|uniref:Hg(II)-responsive transcriptional regulator n=1 Tax=Edaphobacter bradus TaxID=2259016 RepID=UPI0021E0E0E9|nr:Hg(II)-responsive transcriptional regulator [Edaphobacter bradus]